MNKTELPGSRRRAIKKDAALAPAPPGQHVSATVVVRPGTDHDSYARDLREFANAHGVHDVSRHGPHSYRVSGTVATMGAAFEVALKETRVYATGKRKTHRVREGAICISDALLPHTVAVLGLDARPASDARCWRRVGSPKAVAPGDQLRQFTPPQLAKLYGFPTQVDGTGTAVAILEFGGGVDLNDLVAYLGEVGVPATSSVNVVSVDGAGQDFDGIDGAQGEVALDVQVVCAVAPGAAVNVHFAPNTEQGFYDAIAVACFGPPDDPTKPWPTNNIVSISWGGPEDSWTDQAKAAISQAIDLAKDLGINVLVAAGDAGSSDEEAGEHVDFPASSPSAIACGGTRLSATESGVVSEVVWDDDASSSTGGGYSATFPRPDHQKLANELPNRGVPDVAGDADPGTGYLVRVQGQDYVFGGTSAVAPLWAALLALCFSEGRNFAWVLPALYSTPGATNDITQGNNGAYKARAGWDPCTGLGTPRGAAVLELVRGLVPAPIATIPVDPITGSGAV